MDYRVYLMLGFHVSFYHSWRGDTADEAGFGTDIRVVRGLLDSLDRANAAGKQARGYWDAEVYWTFQEILPRHCPDILERLQRRVAAGLDEIVIGPFNNGANHAATADEFRAAVAWAIENPWGSGLRQLFPKVAPLYRPQETMLTVGQETVLKECGVDGLVLYYALVPFNTLSTFTPALPLERRYNPFWFHTREDQPPLVVLPCLAAADVIELTSLEALMLDLHARQRRGEIQSDVAIHLNEDADLETWLPLKLPAWLKWFPNTGGLEEYIHLVDKYPWADFTVPGEYLTSHRPVGQVLVRQDLADGGFDGNYSWAEKCSSLQLWTVLEGSRLASYRAGAWAKGSDLDLGPLLWDGVESSFFQRLIGLSTTHFGMSTPVINEERQARAEAILGQALGLAEQAERMAARASQKKASGALYDFELVPTPPARDQDPAPARHAVRLPLLLPAGVKAVQVERDGKVVPAALTDWTPLADGSAACQVRFVAALEPARSQRYRVRPAGPAPSPDPVTQLANDWLEVRFSGQNGIESIRYLGDEIGRADFLRPFVTYRTKRRPVVYPVERWELLPLTDEQWQGLARLRLRARLPMRTPYGDHTSEFTYTFTLFDDLPHLYVDVKARYAATPCTEIIHNMTQKLRRLMDLRWIEVAPFQLHPRLEAPPGRPLRVWKHNYLGITSYYDLNYGQINPRNRDLDAFNHQVTAGWVAVSDGRRGLLLGENAESLASMAFCPMRLRSVPQGLRSVPQGLRSVPQSLREQDSAQSVWLNPFGSYYGAQLDYSHLGAGGVGAAFLQAFSGALKPNGPSYNGQTVRFSLLLAPYQGDEPPAALQAEAAAHFYPPATVLHAVPDGLDALLPVDISAAVEARLRQAAIAAAGPVPRPTAFLVNPSPGGANLVWDPPRDVPVTGYEAAWRAVDATEWQLERLPPANRWPVTGLADGQTYLFKLRAGCGARWSDWTDQAACVPGAVTGAGLSGFGALPLWSLVRMVAASLGSVVRARLRPGR